MWRKFGLRPLRPRTVNLAVGIGVGVGGFLIARKVWKKRVAAVTASATSDTPATRDAAVVTNEGDDAVVTMEGGEVLQVVDGERGGALPAILNEDEVHGINAEDAAVAVLTGGVDAAVLGGEGIGAVPAILNEDDAAILHVIKIPPVSRSGSTAASSPLISAANPAARILTIEELCFDTLSDTRGAAVLATSASLPAVMSDSGDATTLATSQTTESEALIADAITSTEETTGTEAADVAEAEGSIKEEGTAADSADASITFAGTEALQSADTEVQASFIETTGGSAEVAAGYKNEDDDTDAAVGKSSGEEKSAEADVAVNEELPAAWRTGPMTLKQRTVRYLRRVNVLSSDHKDLVDEQVEYGKITLMVDALVVWYLAFEGQHIQNAMWAEWYESQDPRMITLEAKDAFKEFKKEAKERKRQGLPPFARKATSAAAASAGAAAANSEPDEEFKTMK